MKKEAVSLRQPKKKKAVERCQKALRNKNQVVFPFDFTAKIPEVDIVFTVAEICESLDYTELFNTNTSVDSRKIP